MMLLGDALLCPPVVGAQGKKRPVGVSRLRQTAQVEHGEVAFATAMRPSIDSDGERLATEIVCRGSWLRENAEIEFANGLDFNQFGKQKRYEQHARSDV
jgi:hypothetical protein